MRRHIISLLVVMIVMFTTYSSTAVAGILEDEVFSERNAVLTTSKNLSIYLSTYTNVSYIQIDYCKLQKRNGNTWTDFSDLPVPSYIATQTNIYETSINYSSNINDVGTFRIKLQINGGGHTVVIYSNSRTYNTI